MNYYLDTEFLEGSQKTFFGKTKPTIDLISIGIVSEDSREYYAISKDFNLKEAWNRWQQRTGEGDRNNIEPRLYWLRDNVLKPIYKELHHKENLTARQAMFRCNIYIAETDFKFTYKNFKKLINKYGKTNKQIAEEIVQFVDARWIEEGNVSKGFMYPGGTSIEEVKTTNVQFYGYYADYDWVVFCWLFGKMINLPNGFPMYCVDLKQILDEKAWSIYCNNGTLNSETSLEERIKYLKGESINHLIETNKPKFPKQTNEHNALADARWNYELYKFLNTL